MNVGRGRSPRIWTENEDNLIRKYNYYGSNVLLAERLGCNLSAIVKRRKFLNCEEKGEDKGRNINLKLRSVTSRPAFFEEENLETLLLGRR